MLTKTEQKAFLQAKHSIRLAYSIGVFSEDYAKKRMRDLYARTFGTFSGIYREMVFGDWKECFCDY